MKDTGLAAVRQEIGRACREASRDPAGVTLVAVSKTFDADAIVPVVDAGQRVFGENRVQEAMAKWPALIERTPGLELHMIGPLQSNKAREAVALFHAIHSVDRPSLCEALAKEVAKQDRRPLLFVEINIPPADEAPAPHFALTAKIAARNGLKLLSMGMSADYATAIAMGATHVRVGSAIFGARG